MSTRLGLAEVKTSFLIYKRRLMINTLQLLF
jgi:hypothetical protein